MGVVDEERKAAKRELAAAVRAKARAERKIRAGIKRCKEADISITAIADTIGCNRTTVYDWMKGGKA